MADETSAIEQVGQGYEAMGPNPDYCPPVPRWHHVEVRALDGHEYLLDYDDGGYLEIDVYEPGETLPDEGTIPIRGTLRVFKVDAERDQPVHELRAAFDAATARWQRAEKTLEAVAVNVYCGEGMPEDLQSIFQQLEQDGYNEEWLRGRLLTQSGHGEGE